MTSGDSLPVYDPSCNFRPSNVSGMIDLYDWVGSYYNGTTVIEYTPFSRRNGMFRSCPNVENHTYIQQYQSILGIIEPDRNDPDKPLINMLLGFWHLGFDFSSLPTTQQSLYEQGWDYGLYSTKPWYLRYGYKNKTIPRDGKNFNLSLIKAEERNSTRIIPYTFFNEITTNTQMPSHLAMSPCNNSAVTNTSKRLEYLTTLISDQSAHHRDYSNFTNPTLTLSFNNATANLTVNGYFYASADLSKEELRDRSSAVVGGRMKVKFLGQVDNYHSDVLVDHNSTPAWSRTVGFGNNSLNIGYHSSSGEYQQHQRIVAFSVALLTMGLILSDPAFSTGKDLGAAGEAHIMLFFNHRSGSSQYALTLSAFLLLLFSFPLTTSAASCAGVLLQTIATRWDSLGSAYQSEICARGCQPVMSTWDDWTYSNAFLPLIDTMAKEMSLSDNFKATFTRIGQDIATSTKNECSALLAPGQHFCTGGNTPEGNKLVQWNWCFKKQAAKQASRNAFTILRLVSSEICKGSAYKYLSDDALWTEALPEYMRKYADTCQVPHANEDDGVTGTGSVPDQGALVEKEVKDEL
ncbi:conserved hypothetical protein [Talaromyces stipitatus ATCC 10500]|uniref:Uncharacterized protein n=1 Tax=Talaromyces stipitatus (strain ATCC 10500 / CBS 375.48 / QM 6759 / NRRL 1006) TaxID=441959 RepID=B8M6C8_TALSN|nr:uncharacterized protein TSTA_026140 [Talaromyces stipitatus ATCC 10500]EED19303.1 conserved hypothetical protein [Talaromyces stipitatus ATCC 10500]